MKRIKDMTSTDHEVLRIVAVLLLALISLVSAIWCGWGADSTMDAVGAVAWSFMAQYWLRDAVMRAIKLADQQTEKARERAQETLTRDWDPE